MEIRSFKLASSEEIIGRVEQLMVTEEMISAGLFNGGSCGSITLSKVRLIVPMNSGHGQISPMLLPWVLSNQDAEIKIQKSAIVAEVSPVKEIEDIYLSHTSSISLGGR